MDIATVRDIAAALADTDIDSLEIEGHGVRLRLRRPAGGPLPAPSSEPSVADGSTALMPVHAVAPMAGVFRHGHALQPAAMAQAGATVRAGQAVGLVEVGLLLLPVLAPCAGTVLALAAEDGARVGYGDPLVVLRADGPV